MCASLIGVAFGFPVLATGGVALFSLFLSIARGETICWQIHSVSGWCELPRDDRPFYVRTVRCAAPRTSMEGFYLTAEDLGFVMRQFGARSPQTLIGKQFASPADLGATRAGLGLLALTQKPQMKTILTAQAIYERAAAALSKLQLPDYSDLDALSVLNAFQRAFDCGKTLSKPRRMGRSNTTSTLGWGVNPQWLQWFCARVAQLSHGQVRVRRIDCKKGEMGSSCTGHGPQCEYEELVAVGASGHKLRFDLGYRNTYAILPVDQSQCPSSK